MPARSRPLSIPHGFPQGSLDTRTPLLVSLGATVTNFTLDPIFIFAAGDSLRRRRRQELLVNSRDLHWYLEHRLPPGSPGKVWSAVLRLLQQHRDDVNNPARHAGCRSQPSRTRTMRGVALPESV